MVLALGHAYYLVDGARAMVHLEDVQHMSLFRGDTQLRQLLFPLPENHETGVVQEPPQSEVGIDHRVVRIVLFGHSLHIREVTRQVRVIIVHCAKRSN